jgi:hypothetical protein
MKDAVLSALFKIPDPITADEFSSNRQNGVSRSSHDGSPPFTDGH